MPDLLKTSNDIDHSLSRDLLSWPDSGALSCDVIMSSLNIAHDYPDLDEILDVGDSDMIVNGGGTEPASPTIYGDDYIEDLSHLCSENSEITQQHYKSKINLQPDGVLRHNEDGLLEALRRSMENFESSNLSDLASLSSSLNFAFPNDDLTPSPSSENLFFDDLLMPEQQPFLPGPEDSSSVQEDEDVEEEEQVSVDEQSDEKSNANDSMLKQLLLNPNNNYRKEIDSNLSISENLEKALGNIVNSHDNKLSGRKMKKKKLPQKPFTELLKHLGTPNNQSLQAAPKPKTRVLNAKKYLRQYGSAPASRAGSPDLSVSACDQRRKTVTKSSQRNNTSKSSRTSRLINPKKPLHVTKVYPISQAPVACLKSTRKNDRSANEISFLPSSGKRKGTVLIEPLPKKRQRHGADEAPKKKDHGSALLQERVCHQQPNSDHDYCQKFSVGHENENSTSEATADLNKVVQWEEYLQRVRSGTRSAPNSPASSPKPTRGSLRKSSCGKPAGHLKRSNLTIAHNQSATFASPHVTPIIAAKIQANTKPTIKLQEFKEYLANLNNKRHANATLSSSSAEIVAPDGSLPTKNAVRIVQTSPPVTSTALSFSLANHLPIVQQSKPITPSQPFIKVQSGGKIHTAAVTSAQTLPHHSAQVVMIQIPTSASSSSVRGLLQPNGASTVASSMSISRRYTSNSPSVPPPKIPAPKIKRVATNCKAATRPKKSVAQSTQTGTKSCKSPSSPNLSSPTFKLITSSKGEGQGKSLILSNVTGQLKDILLDLAQLQQGDKSNSTSSSEQQKTLQQLLATITNMKKKQSSNLAPTSSFQSCVESMIPPQEEVSQSKTVARCDENNQSSLSKAPSLIYINPTPSDIVVEPTGPGLCCSQSPHLSTSQIHRVHEDSSMTPTFSNGLFPSSDTFIAPRDSITCDEFFLNLSPKNPPHPLTVPSSNHQHRTFTPVNHYLKSVVGSTVADLLDRVVDACRDHETTTEIPTDHVSVTEQQPDRSAPSLPRAAVSDSNSLCSVLSDDDAFSLAEILKRSDNDDRASSAADVDAMSEYQYYNKLPGYLYSGKLLVPDKTLRVDGSDATLVEHDALSCEVELQNIEYNKLPHYFSSGKLAPREEVVSSHDHVTDRHAGDMKFTPTGSAIDPDDTFYSRLPSYFTCGRAHVVDTVTEPPQLSDEVVTKETLRRQHEESRIKLEEQQRRLAEKRRLRESEKTPVSDDRILYSKLPSYLLSGKKPLAPGRDQDSIHPSQSSSCDLNDPTAKWLRERPNRTKRKNLKKEDVAKNAAILERRVMYVGGIDRSTSAEYLRSRFDKFGAIDEVDLHFRKGKDNYAFVTFRYGNDVVRAIEHGNDDVSPKFVLCFGGRRYFCKVDYEDLDNEPNSCSTKDQEDDFDTLLQQALRR